MAVMGGSSRHRIGLGEMSTRPAGRGWVAERMAMITMSSTNMNPTGWITRVATSQRQVLASMSMPSTASTSPFCGLIKGTSAETHEPHLLVTGPTTAASLVLNTGR